MMSESISGLELSRRFWERVGKPAFEKSCPEILEHAAIGLVGEGSECFGFDDAISRDHDWGPGFCIWLSKDEFRSFGKEVQQIYASLPKRFEGYERRLVSEHTVGRVGVQEIGDFYARYIGFDHVPSSIREWRLMPERGLSVVTNGEIFQDPSGEFTAFRQTLLDYYPEDLRRKKLAKACAVAAQAGQYNYSRCLSHGEPVAAELALGEFLREAMHAIFLLNQRYMPYYKWSHRALGELPILGQETAPLFAELVDITTNRIDLIEKISSEIIAELQRQHLTNESSDFLLSHAETLQRRIEDEFLRNIPLMAE